MTPRQRRFALLIIEGRNPSQAYREAGYGCTNPKTVANEAYKMLNRPDISAMVDEGRKEASMCAVWNRQTSIERNQRVNEVAYGQLVGGDLSRDAMTAFSVTDKRLHELCDLDFERDMRRESIRAEVNGMGMGFNLHPSWSQVQAVINNSDDTEVSDEDF